VSGKARARVPPKEYIPRKRGYLPFSTLGFRVEKPIGQGIKAVPCSPGAPNGTYQQVVYQNNAKYIDNFIKLAETKQHTTLKHVSHEDLEKIVWQKITTKEAGIYGLDVEGSLIDRKIKSCNLNKLGTILDKMLENGSAPVVGVHTSFLYLGMYKTFFP
jgi:hypothetical protein